MDKVIGIDLGTTNCVIAFAGDLGRFRRYGAVTVLEDSFTRQLHASAICECDGELLFGDDAKAKAVEGFAPLRFWKRHMGRGITFPLGGKGAPAHELSRKLLLYVKKVAEEALGERVDAAVITHPAYFGGDAIQATRRAGDEAGLHVGNERLLMEPVAAALACLHAGEQAGRAGICDGQRVLVYDLGGATFDVTVLERSHGEFTPLVFGGDPELGGYNFDKALANHILQHLRGQGYKITIDADHPERDARWAKLIALAEEAKFKLSKDPPAGLKADLLAPRAFSDDTGKSVQLRVTITRAKFEEMIRAMVDATVEECKRVLARKNLSIGQIDRAILVGGSTRVPLVRARLKAAFGRDFEFDDETVDLCVAIGAALAAAGGGEVRRRFHLEPLPAETGAAEFEVAGRVLPTERVPDVNGCTVTLSRDGAEDENQSVGPDGKFSSRVPLSANADNEIILVAATAGGEEFARHGFTVRRCADADAAAPTEWVDGPSATGNPQASWVVWSPGQDQQKPPELREQREQREQRAPQGPDRYHDFRPLGTGRTAVVYRADDVLLRRPVAIKCPREGLVAARPHYRALFGREANHLSRLEHPNIVPLYDFCETRNGPALVMRYVEHNLLDFIPVARHGAPPVGTVARQVAAALDYCAGRGMAHRDVKPDNILVGADGHAYLADFGLAAMLDDDASWTQITGAKPYLSPEILTERVTPGRADSRSRGDQFSFGVTLYQMLTGRLPFDPVPAGQADAQDWSFCTAYRLMRGASPMPCSQHNPNLPPAVDQVLRRMLAVDPETRYLSNAAAADDLDEAVSGRGGRGGLRVFVTYSHLNREFVARLVAGLEKAGLSVWWDEHVACGTRWEEEIEQAMEQCQVMLVVLSPQSVVSDESKNEWRYWLYLKKPVITLVLSDCRIPYRLFPLHHLLVNNRPPEEMVDQVSAAIRKVGQPVPAIPADRRGGGEGTAFNKHFVTPQPLRSSQFILKMATLPKVDLAAQALYVACYDRVDSLPPELLKFLLPTPPPPPSPDAGRPPTDGQ